MTAENHYNQMFKICQMIRTGLKSPGVIEVKPGLKVDMAGVIFGFHLYIENPHIEEFFTDLEEMEQYVLGKIHALRMLQGIKIDLHKLEWRENCARRASGIITESENN